MIEHKSSLRTRGARPSWPRDRRGAVLPLVAVSMVALMAVLVISIDGGSLQREKRISQMAADAGALAGAYELFRTRPDLVVASANRETARNGFQDGVGGAVVTVTNPTTTGYFVGSGFVRVNVERPITNYFAGMFGMGSSTIRSVGTAGVVSALECLVVLDPTGASALRVDTRAKLTADACGITVNSTSNTALNSPASPPETHVTGSFIGVVGNYTAGNYTPTPIAGVAPTLDPLSYLASPPVPATCDYTDKEVTSNQTLSPGTYCGGLSFTGGISTLLPGLYILKGGGLKVQSGGTTVNSTGTGTSFFITPDASGTIGIVDLQANVNINIYGNTDPASALPGILFFQDRTSPYDSNPNKTNTFKAGSTTIMNGTMYFPTQAVDFSSAAETVIKGALIAYRVEVSNNIHLTFTQVNGGQFFPLKRAALVD